MGLASEEIEATSETIVEKLETAFKAWKKPSATSYAHDAETPEAKEVAYLHYPFYERWSRTLVSYDFKTLRTSLVTIPMIHGFDL